MFAIDTNILIYAHNLDSELNEKAATFLENVINEKDKDGNPTVCLPAQVLMEFVNVITWDRLKKPLTLSQAVEIVNDYLNAGVPIITQKKSQINTFLELLTLAPSRKRIFDIALAATLRDNGIHGLYTVNVQDFTEFDFLHVINPLAT